MQSCTQASDHDVSPVSEPDKFNDLAVFLSQDWTQTQEKFKSCDNFSFAWTEQENLHLRAIFVFAFVLVLFVL